MKKNYEAPAMDVCHIETASLLNETSLPLLPEETGTYLNETDELTDQGFKGLSRSQRDIWYDEEEEE